MRTTSSNPRISHGGSRGGRYAHSTHTIPHIVPTHAHSAHRARVHVHAAQQVVHVVAVEPAVLLMILAHRQKSLLLTRPGLRCTGLSMMHGLQVCAVCSVPVCSVQCASVQCAVYSVPVCSVQCVSVPVCMCASVHVCTACTYNQMQVL